MKKSMLFILVVLGFTTSLCSCGDGGSDGGTPPSTPTDYTAFSNPELVTVSGYTGNVMEPFISGDGLYLFFNDNGSVGSEKAMFYATFIDDTTFQYQGAITAINNPAAVVGVPTMDNAYRFYYVSTANYSPPTTFDTLYTGTWTGSTVTGSTAVSGLAITIPGFINFDVEVSPDGTTLYFNDGDFRGGNNFPDVANIVIAVDSGSGFTRLPNSDTIMANVNSSDLEYAPCISADGLEFFFTRLHLSSMKAYIYRAARSTTSDPFGTPQLLSAIDSFVEGPTLSPDEKSLYYHWHNTSTGKFELYRVTRP